jgi:hypothetical protein
MEKQKLIELLRDAYLTGVKEKTFADQMNWLDYDYDAMGGAYAGAVVNNSVLDDVSQQRELLKAFLEWQQNKYSMPYDTKIEWQIKDFEAFYCL